MSAITAENRDFWQKLADRLAPQRPYVGRQVKVEKGRKHKGKQGQVIRHQLDSFDRSTYLYASDAQGHMRDMAGRSGWVCLIRTLEGETFWVKANYLNCTDDKAQGTTSLDLADYQTTEEMLALKATGKYV